MLNAPNKLHGGTAMRACRGIGLVSVERVESKRADDFASMSDEEGSELKRVDDFANMSDEELRQYVYGKKELDS